MKTKVLFDRFLKRYLKNLLNKTEQNTCLSS